MHSLISVGNFPSTHWCSFQVCSTTWLWYSRLRAHLALLCRQLGLNSAHIWGKAGEGGLEGGYHHEILPARSCCDHYSWFTSYFLPLSFTSHCLIRSNLKELEFCNKKKKKNSEIVTPKRGKHVCAKILCIPLQNLLIGNKIVTSGTHS